VGDYGMTSPKPGPIKEPTEATANPMASGVLGDAMEDDDDWFAPPGNPDKGMLGGDNRADLGRMAVAGNPAPEAAMDHDYGWQGDSPLFKVEGDPARTELKAWMRGGSDELGMDGRTGGT